MTYLLLMTWRLPAEEPDWAKAEAHLAALEPCCLVDAYREWLGEEGEDDVCADCRLEEAQAAAEAGLDELKRAYQGHDHALVQTWPDGTRLLAVGGTEQGCFDDPFEGWYDLAFVDSLGVPEALGWLPGIEAAA